eukprot:TRINITY_DN26706_c0_g1_i1.p1 TRINITY_DN26706_c0_g1~~TRINITY_DN26706_c0_g1_i1.p1  ORF type:complete len:823 (+),score=82.31 TRINITY_DN26706_c0_g1_i1:103-2571(+)
MESQSRSRRSVLLSGFSCAAVAFVVGAFLIVVADLVFIGPTISAVVPKPVIVTAETEFDTDNAKNGHDARTKINIHDPALIEDMAVREQALSQSQIGRLKDTTHTFYASNDIPRFADKSRHVLHEAGQLPRVLIYAWFYNSMRLREYGEGGGQPYAASEAYWKSCYAHMHGFNVTFASPSSIRGRQLLSGTEQVDDDNGKLLNDVLIALNRGDLVDTDGTGFFFMMRDISYYLSTGQYDYVFLMEEKTRISDGFLNFPVWMYDLGHDITLMDQEKHSGRFSPNGVLFRASKKVRRFLSELQRYKDDYPFETYVENGKGAFREMMLTWLGLEAEARGNRGYSDACLHFAGMTYKAAHSDSILAAQVAKHNACFHAELDRLTGPFGHRKSELIGFTQTHGWREKRFGMRDVHDDSSVLPLANCNKHFRQSPLWKEECFVIDFNHPGDRVEVATRDLSSCPDPSFKWDHYYGGNDLLWFRDWSQRSKYSGPPRVLIYTWVTENSFSLFVNEVYWLDCYAHAHGFDIVYSTVMNVTGEKKEKQKDGDFATNWYSDAMMWGWHADIGRFLFSGKYDYVFMLGGDVLVHRLSMDFPVWAYDEGHDIIMMDQNYVAYGYNQNAILLKPTDYTREFLDFQYAYRKDFWTQGDNGPWMETMLVYLGREASAAGRPGYDKVCQEHGILQSSSGMLMKTNPTVWVENGTRYCQCFFREIDRLAGTWGHRKSEHIGFTKPFVVVDGREFFPDWTDILSPLRVTPWANCFSWVRQAWPRPAQNCFIFHWNGAKSDKRGQIAGTCPDPGFKWESSPWNFMNRQTPRNPYLDVPTLR